MPIKWSQLKGLVKELAIFQILPAACSSLILEIIRILDSLSNGFSSKVILGSPIYMWILTTLFAIQILSASYTGGRKIHSWVSDQKNKAKVRFNKKLTEINQSYELIAYSWKKTFSNHLLMSLLDDSKNKRLQFYRQIDPRFLPAEDDLSGPVTIIVNEYTKSTNNSKGSTESSSVSRMLRKISDFKRESVI